MFSMHIDVYAGIGECVCYGMVCAMVWCVFSGDVMISYFFHRYTFYNWFFSNDLAVFLVPDVLYVSLNIVFAILYMLVVFVY